MIPYGSMFFFYILILALIPALILGLMEIKIKFYGMFINLLMIIIFFGPTKTGTICLILFYIGELILIKSYLYIRKRFDSRWILRLMILFSIIPLILVKSSHLYTTMSIGFLGISYLTFKCVHMLIETYDGLIKEVKIIDFSYFLLFFPTISSGHIDRSRRFLSDINKVITRDEYITYIHEGLYRFF